MSRGTTDLGTAMRHRRRNKAMSMVKAAEAAGLALSHYRKIETGEVVTISGVTMAKLERALGKGLPCPTCGRADQGTEAPEGAGDEHPRGTGPQTPTPG